MHAVGFAFLASLLSAPLHPQKVPGANVSRSQVPGEFTPQDAGNIVIRVLGGDGTYGSDLPASTFWGGPQTYILDLIVNRAFEYSSFAFQIYRDGQPILDLTTSLLIPTPGKLEAKTYSFSFSLNEAQFQIARDSCLSSSCALDLEFKLNSIPVAHFTTPLAMGGGINVGSGANPLVTGSPIPSAPPVQPTSGAEAPSGPCGAIGSTPGRSQSHLATIAILGIVGIFFMRRSSRRIVRSRNS